MNFDFEVISTKEYRIKCSDLIYSEAAYISPTPTGNCQVCSVSKFDHLLLDINNYEDLKDLLKIICQLTNKSLILLDLNNEMRDKLFNILNSHSNCVILNESYISSNQSEMNLVIINCTKIV